MENQLKIKEIQELCRRALMGRKGGYIAMIAEHVGTSTETVRNALKREDVLRLTNTERKCLLVAAEMAKPFINATHQLEEELKQALK